MIKNTQNMRSEKPKLAAVPTNIITGFLGSGKTTVILNLLKHKPASERWAVLVNEFGEVGVDGSFLEGDRSQGVFVREVPGGCMCCAAGLPMHIALNQLISRARPDRLLIEPTGLGHPKEVLEALSAEHYRDVLEIQKCITLVDARKVLDRRYTEHDTFNQQIDMADLIVGHKVDLYGVKERQALMDYVHARRGEDIAIEFVEKGALNLGLLRGESQAAKGVRPAKTRQPVGIIGSIDEQAIPAAGYLRKENRGSGFFSVGWRFSPTQVFDKSALFVWLSGLKVERAKGVFITNEGIFAYNITADAITEMELDDCMESRIEIISDRPTTINEDDLLACLEPQ